MYRHPHPHAQVDSYNLHGGLTPAHGVTAWRGGTLLQTLISLAEACLAAVSPCCIRICQFRQAKGVEKYCWLVAWGGEYL